MNQLVRESLDFSVVQSMKLYKSLENNPDKLPRTFEDGKLITSGDRAWTSGFFPGVLWYLYEYTDNQQVKEAAQEMTARVINQQYTTDNHDVGFIINCSFGNGYRLTGDSEYQDVIVTASKSLATRFRPVTECIRSWNHNRWEYPVIIDNMMNLELLSNGTKFSGDSRFLEIARSHADATMVNHFRTDGSSCHVVDYDTITGSVRERCTHQGYSDKSAWSRGQAWGLYGYVMMYRETQEINYLNHAIKIGNFIADHPNMPEDKIPYWDFDAPDIPNALRDASAGAIMASAYVELSTFVDKQLSAKYLSLGETQLRALSSLAYRANPGENGNFLLKHSVGFMGKGGEVDVPLTYADYYYVEALIRYLNLSDHN